MSQEEAFNEFYDPKDEDRETINFVLDRVSRMQYNRDRKQNYFNERNLITYIDDSTKRWLGYIPPRDDITLDWQAHVFNNFTHNVVISFLSKVATKPPQSRFIATNSEGYEDVKRAHILEKMCLYTRRRENAEHKFFLAALECVTKGTVIQYEGYRKIKRKVKEVTKYDVTTGKISYDEKEIVDFNDCYSQVIPLEDFYVGNVWQADMQLQPDVVWKSIVRRVEAKEEFSKYQNWKYVKPGAYTSLVEGTPFYRNKVFAELEADQIEIIRYYNRLKDQFVVVANGVLLYDGPIPFAHKMYPFAKTVYEPFAIDFFYGKSLPDKIATDQDVINTLWNMGLDQQYLSIFKPILTSDPDEVEETILVPGLIRKVNDVNAYRVMNELTGPDSSYFNMLQLAFKYAGDNSGSMMGGGGAATPRGGKISARQALLAEEQARQVLGLNAKLLEFFSRDAEILRCKNILQFYTIPEKIEDISGTKAEEYKKAFMRIIRIDDTELSDGTYGTSIIRVARDKKSMPSQEDIAVEEEVAKMQGENVEIHVVSPDYIRNMDFDIQIIPESTFQQSKSLGQAMGMEYITTKMKLFPELSDKMKLSRDLDKLYDKDPDEMTVSPQQPPPQGMPMGVPGQQGIGSVPAQLLGRGQEKSIESLV